MKFQLGRPESGHVATSVVKKQISVTDWHVA